MKEIKMKESSRIPKVRNPAGKMPKELAKMTALEAKEKSHRIADNVRAGEVQESPTEYASAKVETAEEWAAGKAASVSSAITRGMAKKSYEKIRERSRERTLAENIELAGEYAPAGEPAHLTVPGKSDMPGHPSMPGQPSASGTGNSGMERLKKNRAKDQISGGQKIRTKPDRKVGLHASSSRSVKTAPRIVNTKFSDSSSKQVRAGMGTAQRWQKLHTETAAKQMAVNSAKAAQAGAKQGVYYGNKAVQTTARGISTAVRSLQALMAGGIGIAVFFVIMIGVIGGILCNNSSQSSEPLSPEVLNYTPIIQRYAQEYGIPECRGRDRQDLRISCGMYHDGKIRGKVWGNYRTQESANGNLHIQYCAARSSHTGIHPIFIKAPAGRKTHPCTAEGCGSQGQGTFRMRQPPETTDCRD